MAYIEGNAIFVRPTKVSAHDVCGSVTIRSNVFVNNIGMKVHNGGAIAAVCRVLSSASHIDYLSNSGHHPQGEETINVDYLPNVAFASIANPGLAFSMPMYSFTISSCTFTRNFSGRKGTAIYSNYMDIV